MHKRLHLLFAKVNASPVQFMNNLELLLAGTVVASVVKYSNYLNNQ